MSNDIERDQLNREEAGVEQWMDRVAKGVLGGFVVWMVFAGCVGLFTKGGAGLGAFGDSFGPLTGFATALALLMAMRSIQLQRNEMTEDREVYKKQALAMLEQTIQQGIGNELAAYQSMDAARRSGSMGRLEAQGYMQAVGRGVDYASVEESYRRKYPPLSSVEKKDKIEFLLVQLNQSTATRQLTGTQHQAVQSMVEQLDSVVLHDAAALKFGDFARGARDSVLNAQADASRLRAELGVLTASAEDDAPATTSQQS